MAEEPGTEPEIIERESSGDVITGTEADVLRLVAERMGVPLDILRAPKPGHEGHKQALVALRSVIHALFILNREDYPAAHRLLGQIVGDYLGQYDELQKRFQKPGDLSAPPLLSAILACELTPEKLAVAAEHLQDPHLILEPQSESLPYSIRRESYLYTGPEVGFAVMVKEMGALLRGLVNGMCVVDRDFVEIPFQVPLDQAKITGYKAWLVDGGLMDARVARKRGDDPRNGTTLRSAQERAEAQKAWLSEHPLLHGVDRNLAMMWWLNRIGPVGGLEQPRQSYDPLHEVAPLTVWLGGDEKLDSERFPRIELNRGTKILSCKDGRRPGEDDAPHYAVGGDVIFKTPPSNS
ncbi:MAG: hypothetical protein V1908_00030 [Candidatus Peregrinibacteria bacterium]